MRDIFGNEISAAEARRLNGIKSPRADGYAAMPGSGPKGETCKTCYHLYRNHQAKVYLKCNLARGKWTGGRKSDVLASAPACEKWEQPF